MRYLTSRFTGTIAASVILGLGLSAPVQAMESPERVYAHQSCDGDRWNSYSGQFSSFEECFYYSIAEYQQTCPWDDERHQCFI